MSFHRNRLRHGIAITGIALLLPATAGAQQGEVLEEIVVTATRRVASLSDVPASVSALTESQLQQKGARKIEDYILSVPGVSFTNAGEEIGADFTLRGVSSLSGAATTTTYVDETPLPTDIRLFDVERVEVLRGPQGTLFGASTMGGAIRTITRKPDSGTLSAQVEVAGSKVKGAGDPDSSLNAAVNIPLIESRLALRASIYRDDIQGLHTTYQSVLDNATRRVTPTDKVLTDEAGGRTVKGGRAALRLEAADDLSATATFYHQKDHALGYSTTDFDVYGKSRKQTRALGESTSDRFSLGNLLVDKDFGFASLISSTSFSQARNRNQTDGTAVLSRLAFTLNGIPGIGGFITGPVAGVPLTNDSKPETLTQEVRLTSAGGGAFTWLGGFFFNREQGDFTQRIRLTPASSTALTGGEIYNSRRTSEDREVSVFGEGSVELDDALKLTLGVRRYWLDNENTTRRAGILAVAQGQDTVLGPLKASEDGGTYKANLAYSLPEAGLIYAQASSGYRPGGANPPNPLGGVNGEPVTPDSYSSDKLWQYEAGWRGLFMDGRVGLNLAAYYTDWQKIQSVQSTPTGFNYIGNFGDAHTKGFEAELTARPSREITLGATYAYTLAQYDSDIVDEGVEKGDPIPGIPCHSYSAFLSYERPVTDVLDGYLRLDLSHMGERRAKPGEETELQSYTLVNARLGLTWGETDISLFADNLTNTERVVGARPLGSNLRLSYLRPRTIGLRVRTGF